VLDCLTFPQVLFCTLKKAEWEHREMVWQLRTGALAAAAGFGSKEAGKAIDSLAQRKLGERRPRTFGEMLERARAGGQ